jgi:hypothetical protein
MDVLSATLNKFQAVIAGETSRVHQFAKLQAFSSDSSAAATTATMHCIGVNFYINQHLSYHATGGEACKSLIAPFSSTACGLTLRDSVVLEEHSAHDGDIDAVLVDCKIAPESEADGAIGELIVGMCCVLNLRHVYAGIATFDGMQHRAPHLDSKLISLTVSCIHVIAFCTTKQPAGATTAMALRWAPTVYAVKMQQPYSYC